MRFQTASGLVLHFHVDLGGGGAEEEQEEQEEEEEEMPEWADENVAPPTGALEQLSLSGGGGGSSSGDAIGGQGDKAGRQLVLALVEHCSNVLQNAMAPFLEAHCHLFEQDVDELSSGAGETHEQFGAFNSFVAELEPHFDEFVLSRGGHPPTSALRRLMRRLCRTWLSRRERWRAWSQSCARCSESS